MRCLIIDDSKAMRAFLSAIIRELGFETYEASNGQEALDRLRELEDISFALVDWNMPVMNGFEFVKAVRRNADYDELKLMMVTTETEITQVEKALRAGANEYMMKPFSKEMLVEKLTMLGFDEW